MDRKSLYYNKFLFQESKLDRGRYPIFVGDLREIYSRTQGFAIRSPAVPDDIGADISETTYQPPGDIVDLDRIAKRVRRQDTQPDLSVERIGIGG